MPSITVLRDPRRLQLAIFLLASVLVVALLAGCAAAAPSGTSTPVRTGAAARPAATAQAATQAVAGRTCAPPYPTGAPAAETVFCADPAAMTAARVLRIVDGDTLHVELRGRDETVRLYGTNATERGQPCSDEATRRLHELAGGEVRLRADARERDRFGRLLRYVYSTSGLSIDAEMVDEGLAHAWRSDGDLRFAIIALETRASVDRRGCLWR
jgi:endonuclease YncB( thermonuclease family)